MKNAKLLRLKVVGNSPLMALENDYGDESQEHISFCDSFWGNYGDCPSEEWRYSHDLSVDFELEGLVVFDHSFV
jgi:hypothetical protein